MKNHSAPDPPKGKVLIVDDAPDTLEIIGKLLRFEGYEVITALTGEDGVSRAEKEKPEVVLLDISLPGINGTEALKQIRKMSPLACVVMLTAFATVDNAIQALKEGASDFIKKPFENDHLVHVVNQCLEKHQTLKEKERLEDEVRRLSITDDLTSLYNHRHFFKTLESELARMKRQKTSLSLLMFDVDNFKKYNDTFGHVEGDRVLRKIGEVVWQSIRSNVDSGYRYGGDEFAALLIGATLDHAITVAERIRVSIEDAGFADITVSIGLAEYQPHLDLEEFLKAADDAMYLAKHSGGNRVHEIALLPSGAPESG
ncbi:MAG: diguanylate cyclase [Deltaproteobacteria bacterium]|nr:MAG: diguanylate cyclase [Deltaproteobacteria bacterium]